MELGQTKVSSDTIDHRYSKGKFVVEGRDVVRCYIDADEEDASETGEEED
jgi:hypothetical protein